MTPPDPAAADFARRLRASYDGLADHWPALAARAAHLAGDCRHGDLPRWLAALDDLPARLMDLHPWRKGPLTIAGQLIDSEWRSDWKFDRLQAAGIDVTGKRLFDVGCGNGIYMHWMIAAGARAVLGVEPTLLFAAQYLALKSEHPGQPFYLLPCTLEALSPDERSAIGADITLSAGVLYHRPDPIGHLRELIAATRPGGQVIVETLVIPGDAQQVLVPRGRYAQMRNVWFLPSSAALALWLERAGLRAVRLLDETETSVEEQRRTDWMTFHSLSDFLDPRDASRTVEGHPRPRRAILCGNKPLTG